MAAEGVSSWQGPGWRTGAVNLWGTGEIQGQGLDQVPEERGQHVKRLWTKLWNVLAVNATGHAPRRKERRKSRRKETEFYLVSVSQLP